MGAPAAGSASPAMQMPRRNTLRALFIAALLVLAPTASPPFGRRLQPGLVCLHKGGF